eukprot:2117861-Heterocapsa_arctica.AAC.1
MSTNSMGAFNLAMTSPVIFARRASVSSNLQVCGAPEKVHDVDPEVPQVEPTGSATHRRSLATSSLR